MNRTRAQLAALLGVLLLLAVATAPALLLARTSGSSVAATLTPGGPAATWEGRVATLRMHGLGGLDPAGDALLVVAPAVAYSQDDVARLRAFVLGGGRALIASDTGAGADLVRRLDMGLELTSVRVYSPDFAGDPDRLLATPTSEIPRLTGSVVLERPVLVRGGNPVLLPPELAWEDRNGNGLPDLDEPLVNGSFGALAPLASGALLVLGDPDAVAAAAPTHAELLGWLTEDGTRMLVVDEAHRALDDPLALAPALAGDLGLAASTGMLMFALGVGAFVVLAPRLRRRQPSAAIPATGAAIPPETLSKILGELDP